MDNQEKVFESLNNATEKANLLATEIQLQFETMAELQKDERLSWLEMFAKEKQEIREHYEKILQKNTRIILGLVLTLLIIIGSFIGGAIYLLENYEFSYYQSAEVGGDGNANIYDGIHQYDVGHAE